VGSNHDASCGGGPIIPIEETSPITITA